MHSSLRSLSIAAVFGAAFLPSPAVAQEAGFHVVAFTTGATTMQVDAVNKQLTASGFAGLSNDGISYGLTGHVAFGHAQLGIDVARTTFGEEGLSTGHTDDLNSTQLLGTAAYAIYTTPRVSVFPAFGVGVGTFDISLRDRSGAPRTSVSQPTFAEVAQSPGATSTISGHHLLFSAGLGADLLVTRGSAGTVGVVFGIRAGILAAPNRTTWTSDGRDVLAGPDASAGGPFLRVIIGIGGR